MSTTEAAARLACTRQNVQDLYQRGQLEAAERKTGGPIRLYVDSVEAYAHSRRGHSTDQGQDPGSAAHPGDQAERLLERLSEAERRLEEAEERDRDRARRVAELNAAYICDVEADEELLAARAADLDARMAELTAARAHIDAELARIRRNRVTWTRLTEESAVTHVPGLLR